MKNCKKDIHISATLTALGKTSAVRWRELAIQAIEAHGQFHVALSGGSTPRLLFKNLARLDLSAHVDWNKVQIYFGDERFVPAGHPDSNFRMANETLLQYVPVPPQNIHRIVTEDLEPDQAAEIYSATLKQCLPKDASGNPRFDLVMLGLGPDGHIASLFPETAILKEKNKQVAAVYLDKFKCWRISICFPVINHAAHLMFLVAGKNKADVISHVIGGVSHDVVYPVEMINPLGHVDWFLDAGAAKRVGS